MVKIFLFSVFFITFVPYYYYFVFVCCFLLLVWYRNDIIFYNFIYSHFLLPGGNEKRFSLNFLWSLVVWWFGEFGVLEFFSLDQDNHLRRAKLTLFGWIRMILGYISLLIIVIQLRNNRLVISGCVFFFGEGKVRGEWDKMRPSSHPSNWTQLMNFHFISFLFQFL